MINQTKKIILVAKCFDSSQTGPANVVRELIKNFEKRSVNFEAVLLKENESKLKYLKKLINTIRKNNNTVFNIHIDGFFLPLFVKFLSHFYKKNSYYWTVHGIYAIEAKMEQGRQKKYIFLEKKLYKNIQNIICVSEMLKNDLVKMFHLKSNVIVIPNATDAKSNAIHKENTKKKIIFLGGLRLCKGIDHVIKLATILKSQRIDVCVDIYGAKDCTEEWLNSEIEKNNLKGIIEYKGLLRDKQTLYDEIKKADFQLCLSRYDTYNVAIAESLVLGCPCISSNKCGASTLIKSNFDGIIVDFQEGEGAYTKIVEYIKTFDEKKRKDIENNLEFRRKQLSWDNIINKYCSLE